MNGMMAGLFLVATLAACAPGLQTQGMETGLTAIDKGFESGTGAGQVRRSYIDGRFGQIHVRSIHPAGAGDRKRPVVMLHLSPNSGQVFARVMPLLGADRIVLAPDYPGYGMSDEIAGEQTIEKYASAMIDVIEATNLVGPVDLVGYHTGTGVALAMVGQRPELFGKVALIAVPVLTAEERAAGAALPRIAFDTDGDFAKAEWQSSWRWRGPGQDVPSVLATFAEKMRPGAREKGATAILNYAIDKPLETMSKPLLIVRVKDDLWEATARARQLRPDAEYVELPGYGHGLFDAAPAHMDELLRQFLDDQR